MTHERFQITSDGVGTSTRVSHAGEQLNNVTKATWTCAAGDVARATLEVDLFGSDLAVACDRVTIVTRDQTQPPDPVDTVIAKVESDAARMRVALALLASFVFGLVVMAVIFNVAAL